MPRVLTQTARKSKHERKCVKCGKPIEVGQRYHLWEFRYGGSYTQHETCGMPRPSQLTQSKLSQAYAGREGVEDLLAGDFTLEDLVSALQECASEAESVRDEYQDSLSNMPTQEGPVAEQIQEYIDSLESWISELESAISSIEGQDEPDESEVEEEIAQELIREVENQDQKEMPHDVDTSTAGEDPVKFAKEHFTEEFDRRVDEAMDEKRDELKSEASETAQTALDALGV